MNLAIVSVLFAFALANDASLYVFPEPETYIEVLSVPFIELKDLSLAPPNTIVSWGVFPDDKQVVRIGFYGGSLSGVRDAIEPKEYGPSGYRININTQLSAALLQAIQGPGTGKRYICHLFVGVDELKLINVLPKDYAPRAMSQRMAFIIDNAVSLPPGMNVIPFCEPFNADVGMLGRFSYAFLNVEAFQEKFRSETVLPNIESLNFRYLVH